MGDAITKNLTAELVTNSNGQTALVLYDNSTNPPAVNPTVSFKKNSNNKIVFSCSGTSFYFAGLSLSGVDANGNPVTSSTAALEDFVVEMNATQITLKDKIDNNSETLYYEYIIYGQRTSDGARFQDDPRIINTTG